MSNDDSLYQESLLQEKIGNVKVEESKMQASYDGSKGFPHKRKSNS